MPQPKKKTKIDEFTEAVQAQQAAVLDARDGMGKELLDHMMQLPSLAAVFSDEEDKQMFSTQLAYFIDGALRAQQDRQRQREVNAAIAEQQTE